MNEDKQLINIENNPLNVNRYGEYEVKYSSDRYKIQDDGVEQYKILETIGYVKQYEIPGLTSVVFNDLYLEDPDEISTYLSSYHPDMLSTNLEFVSIQAKTVTFEESTKELNALITYIVDKIPYSANPVVDIETISSWNENDEVETTDRITGISYTKLDPEFNGGKIVQDYKKEYEDVEVLLTGLSSFNKQPQNTKIQSIEFGNTVFQIGAEALRGNTVISSLTIPYWVKYIGKDAFADTNLTFYSVSFDGKSEDQISSMENYPWGLPTEAALTKVWYTDGTLSAFHIKGTFKGYPEIPDRIFGVERVRVGNAVTKIDSYAFKQWQELKSVILPDTVTSIGYGAFMGCPELSSIRMSNYVTFIGSYAFSSCPKLTSLDLPDGLSSLGSHSFYKCDSLSSIEIPDTVQNKLFVTFAECKSLTSVKISNKTPLIDSYTFDGCSALTQVDIPESVKTIGGCAFRACSSLSSISLPGINRFTGTYAFSRCSNLQYVNLGGRIDTEYSSPMGKYTFNLCDNLKEVRFEQNYQSEIESRNGYPWKVNDTSVFKYLIDYAKTTFFYNDGTTASVQMDGELSASAVPNRENLVDVLVGTNVTRIGAEAFRNCSNLNSISMPDTVEIIGNNAFTNCTKLTAVDFGNSIKTIGTGAFQNCTNLSSISLPESLVNINSSAFDCCEHLSSLSIPSNVAFIGTPFISSAKLTSIEVDPNNSTFDSRNNCNAIIQKSNNKLICGCESTIIPSSVETIGKSAFYNNSTLKSIVIPNGVKAIEATAFKWCSALSSVSICGSVKTIDYNAFGMCTRLNTVKFEEGTETIQSQAFRDCYNLSSIELPDSVTSLAGGVFQNCRNLTSVKLSNSITVIKSSLFSACTKLKEVTIPPTVKTIESLAFDGCSELEHLEIPVTVTTIQRAAFQSCPKLFLRFTGRTFAQVKALSDYPWALGSYSRILADPVAWDKCTKSSNWGGDNASIRYMNILSPNMSYTEFQNRVSWIKNRGCNCVNVFITNKGDGECAGYSPYGNPTGVSGFRIAVSNGPVKSYTAEMTKRIRYMYESGLGVNLWLMADDSMEWSEGLKSTETIKKYYADIKDLGWFDLASTVIIGLEVEEYWNNESIINKLISFLRHYYSGKIGIHHCSEAYHLGTDADIHFIQLDPGSSSSTITSFVKAVKSETKKPVNMFELERHPDRERSQVALDAGAYGVGNW